MTCIKCLLVLLPAAIGQLITLQKTADNSLKIVAGFIEPWVAHANLTDNQKSTGWLHLDIRTNEQEADDLQAEAAGVAEGYLTSFLATKYYEEFIDKSKCQVDPEFCPWMEEKFQQNWNWTQSMLSQTGNTSDYWNMVRLFYKQLDGLRKGWIQSSEESFYRKFNPATAFWFLNLLTDLEEYSRIFVLEKNKTSSQAVQFPSCSVLIKQLTDDVIMAHSAWHDYRALAFRILKKYQLPYHLSNGSLVPGHTITMSSYAGTLSSLDDFYSISSGLAATETTLNVYATNLLQLIQPLGQIWEPVRVMVSNRLATTGKEWTKIFEKFNSGTYNNQWMVVDYNKVKRGEKSGVLYVVEQMPGMVESIDATDILLRDGYWASYNRPYLESTYQRSGSQDMVAKYGNWFSHGNTPRAQIFRAHHATVKDKQSMFKLMRSNNYTSSPYSTPEGCTGPITSGAIAARNDLQSPEVACNWSQHDPMMGRAFYGALDLKMMDKSDICSQSFLAVSGPTYEGSMPPFSWKGQTGGGVPDYIPIMEFKFPRIAVSWRRADASLPAAAHCACVNYPLAIVLACLAHLRHMV